MNWFATAEADVVTVLTNFKKGFAVAEADVIKALDWIAGNAPTIASDLTTAVTLVEAVGGVSNPEVNAAIIAANTAVVALNSFAAAQKTGASGVQAVVEGYVAMKQAHSAAASAAAAAAALPVPPVAALIKAK